MLIVDYTKIYRHVINMLIIRGLCYQLIMLIVYNILITGKRDNNIVIVDCQGIQ